MHSTVVAGLTVAKRQVRSKSFTTFLAGSIKQQPDALKAKCNGTDELCTSCIGDCLPGEDGMAYGVLKGSYYASPDDCMQAGNLEGTMLLQAEPLEQRTRR
jgi:hypothetical protein